MQKFHGMAFFLLPVLRVLSDHKALSRKEIATHVAQELALSQEEIEERTNKGNQSKLQDRVHWASYYLNRAGLVSLNSSRFTITARGQAYLSRGLSSIAKHDLEEFPEFVEFLTKVHKGQKSKNSDLDEEIVSDDLDLSSPVERLLAAQIEIGQRLKDELLQKIMDQSPSFFEHLVKDLLIAMGYGWSAAAGEVVGKSGDGGIDVVLYLDRLRLTKVYVQAKKWQHKIGAGELRDFVGALTAHHASRGVFITTSDFQQSADSYLSRVPLEVALINGEQLAELCIEFGVGVVKAETFVLKRLDVEYFDG